VAIANLAHLIIALKTNELAKLTTARVFRERLRRTYPASLSAAPLDVQSHFRAQVNRLAKKETAA
jgi:hypothetical protein